MEKRIAKKSYESKAEGGLTVQTPLMMKSEDGIRDSPEWLEFRRVLFRSSLGTAENRKHEVERNMEAEFREAVGKHDFEKIITRVLF